MAGDKSLFPSPDEGDGAEDGSAQREDGQTAKDELADDDGVTPPTDEASGGEGDAVSSPQMAADEGEGGAVGVGRREGLANISTGEIMDVRIQGGWGVEVAEDKGVGVAGRGGLSAYVTRDLTQGSVPKNLWFLAWPQMIEGILNVVDQMADLFWAGRFVGARAIAGLGVAQNYTHMVMTGRIGLDMGMQAMIARAIGAGRVDLANHVALQAFTLTATFSVLMAAVGVLFSDFLMQILGVSDEVIQTAGLYMKIQFIGFGTQAFRMMSGSALQASGDALTPMKATLIARVTHIVISPILFFGVWFVPETGIGGLALGNVVAQSLAVVWNFHALFTGTSRLHLTLRGYHLDFPLLRRLVRIGAPASLTGMERGLVNILMVPMVTPFGDFSLAAYGLTRRLEMFTNLGSMGLGRASGTLVGQNLGAGSKQRAKSTVLWALGYVTAIRGSLGVLLLLFPAFFIAIFNQEAGLMDVATAWVRIQAVGGLVMGAGMVFQMSFNVAGDTVAPMIVTLVTMVGVQLPLAFALSRWTGMGQYGIPVAITVAMFSRILLYIPYYIRGRWLQAKVID